MTKRTRADRFLDEMNRVVPRADLAEVVAPHYQVSRLLLLNWRMLWFAVALISPPLFALPPLDDEAWLKNVVENDRLRRAPLMIKVACNFKQVMDVIAAGGRLGSVREQIPDVESYYEHILFVTSEQEGGLPAEHAWRTGIDADYKSIIRLLEEGKGAAARVRMESVIEKYPDITEPKLIYEKYLKPYYPRSTARGRVFVRSKSFPPATSPQASPGIETRVNDLSNPAVMIERIGLASQEAKERAKSSLTSESATPFFGFWSSERFAKDINDAFPDHLDRFSSAHRENTITFEVITVRAYYGVRIPEEAETKESNKNKRLRATPAGSRRIIDFDVAPSALTDGQVEAVAFLEAIGEPRTSADQVLLRSAFAAADRESQIEQTERFLHNATARGDQAQKARYEDELKRLSGGHHPALATLQAEIRRRGIRATTFIKLPADAVPIPLENITTVPVRESKDAAQP